MIPIGYMAKRVSRRPEWLHAPHVVDVYSVSHCVSPDFADYINDWKHNGYWFFDSPEVIRKIAQEHAIDLHDTTLFYYEVHELEFDGEQNRWKAFAPDLSFTTNVLAPVQRKLEGYDVVTFWSRTSAECSPLSCNGLAADVATNQHCLLSSREQAEQLLENGSFKDAEPGPYRIFSVYTVAAAERISSDEIKG